MTDPDLPDEQAQDPNPPRAGASDAGRSDGERISRGRTAARIGLSLIFVLLARVAEGVLGAVIVFELLYALVTERPPSVEVRRFANRVLSYLVEVARYLTCASDAPPFPFADFPPELDYVRKKGTAV
jgi:hypothetical protein